MSDASTARANGWRVGTLLAGDEGDGETVIRITAIGDRSVLAVAVSHDGRPLGQRESMWHFAAREWRVVGGADGLDQSGPAAWLLRDVTSDGDLHEQVTTSRAVVDAYRERVGGTVTPLRAPGAVAAAPPGDEEVAEAWWDNLYESARSFFAGDEPEGPCLWAWRTGWNTWEAHLGEREAARLARQAGQDEVIPLYRRPAPPAGHEDEAAVERVRDLHPRRDDDTGPHCGHCFATWPCPTVRALAAARGPRTPDPTEEANRG